MIKDMSFEKFQEPITVTIHPTDIRNVQITNADRIRAMTDEELAKFFDDIETKAYMSEYRGVLGWLEWLKEEAVDNGACLAKENKREGESDK